MKVNNVPDLIFFCKYYILYMYHSGGLSHYTLCSHVNLTAPEPGMTVHLISQSLLSFIYTISPSDLMHTGPQGKPSAET